MSDSTVIGSRFEIGEMLGAGGMGTVYRGVDQQTQEAVAVKLLKPELVASDPDMLARFDREGEALRQLNHPNIVKVLATVQDKSNHYIVMELMGGGSLYDLLKQQPQMPINRVLHIALDLSDALTRAHRLNIIHRDIKPGNVLIADDGTPRLTDFGVARMGNEQRVTQTGAAIGTLDYLSPEALEGKDANPRTDIWAFGVLLYEMLAGHRPFEDATFTGVITAILTKPVPDLEERRPDCPIALVDLIYRMLEKDVNQRIPSVRQIGLEIEGILQGRETPIPNASPVKRDVTIDGAFDTPTPALDAVKNNLPKQPTPFVGREHELAEIAKLLNDPQIQLITIVAPGGMGKTRLALESAELVLSGTGTQPPFTNGVYLIQLAPLAEVENIIPTIADAVGFTFYAGGEPKQQLLDYLREKSILLLMDNFEHLLSGAEIVSDIMAAASHVKIIATSRERLNLRGEIVYSVSGMDFPEWETPADALQYSAVKLFMQSAKRAQPGFELHADDLTYVARICRLVFGMPLGIELAASWVEMLSLKEIADEITASLDFLETEMRDVPERHRSMRGVFEYSWNLLTDDEKASFAKVAVFRGGFSRQAAQTVTGASLKQLAGLVNKSLLKRDPESGVYQIHELLHQYADEKLESSGLADQIRDAHSDYYLDALHQRQRGLEGGKQLEYLKDIESDIENVRAAWLWAAKYAKYEAIDNALHSLWLYYFFRNQHIDGESIFEQAVAYLGNLPPSPERDGVLGALMSRQAFFSVWLDHRETAQRLLQVSEPLLQRNGTSFAQAFWALIQGDIYSDWKDARDSRPFYEQSLTLYREAGNRWGEARSLGYRSYSYWFRLSPQETNLTEANRYLQEALAIQEAIGDVFGMTATLMSLANVAGMSRDFEVSRQRFERSLELSKQVGDTQRTASNLMNFGVMLTFAGHFEQARQSYLESLSLLREQGHVRLMIWSLINLALLAYDEGLFDECSAYQEEVVALTEGTEREDWFLSVLVGRADVMWAQGDYRKAADDALRALSRSEASENHEQAFHACRVLGKVMFAQGDYVEAQKYIERGWQIGQDHNRLDLQAELYSQRVILAYQQGDYVQASQYVTLALTYFRSDEARVRAELEAINKAYAAMILGTMGDVARSQGDLDAAYRYVREALTLAWPLSIPAVLSVLPSIADLLAAEAQLARAAELTVFVQHNLKAYAVDRTRAGNLLESLKEKLSADVYRAAVEHGKSLELSAVVTDFLAEEDADN